MNGYKWCVGWDDEDDDNLNDENVAVDLDVDAVDVKSLDYNLMYTHTLNARFQKWWARWWWWGSTHIFIDENTFSLCCMRYKL